MVVPTLNEEANVRQMAAAVAQSMRDAEVSDYELLFIDNGSSDQTLPLLRALCADDPRIRVIVNARNFGQMRSPTYGIYQTRGRAVVSLCADFQDPPTLIPEFVRRWRAGDKIVLATRRSEANGPVRRGLRAFAYGFLARFGDYPVIPGATGFGLYDRRVVEELKGWNEPEPFFRGMLVETGHTLSTLPFDRPLRMRGASKNSFATLSGFVISSVAGSSKGLLRLPLALGAVLAVTVLPAVPITFWLAGWRRPGALLATLGGGLGLALTFLFLGVLGEQVRLLSARTRDLPLVVEKERINFASSEARESRPSRGANA